MKQTKFEKIVEWDKKLLVYTWFHGLVSILLPLMLLLITPLTFSDIVINAFLDGMVFVAFVQSIIEYGDSRKVYWRKIK